MILTGRELKGYNFDVKIQFMYLIPYLGRLKFYHEYFSFETSIITIEKGYAWDGSSIPLKKWFKRIWDADKYCKKASLVHDALCQAMREDLLAKSYKEYIDGLYRDMCIQGGMGKREANLRYWFLRKFGDRGIRKEKNPRGKVFEI